MVITEESTGESGTYVWMRDSPFTRIRMKGRMKGGVDPSGHHGTEGVVVYVNHSDMET